MDKKEEKNNKKEKTNKKVLNGVVVSDKMKDTCTVLVTRFVKDRKYKKFHKVNKKFKAHDVGNTKVVGDKVSMMESKPISKNKHFVIIN